MVDDTGASIEKLCGESRTAILAISDRILELTPIQGIPNSEAIASVQRLLNRLAWHLGVWKSYGTSDTAERVQAALNLVRFLTPTAGSEKWSSERWEVRRDLMIHMFQTMNGMALLPDKKRLSPLLVRELHAQIEADLKMLKLEFGARASRV